MITEKQLRIRVNLKGEGLWVGIKFIQSLKISRSGLVLEFLVLFCFYVCACVSHISTGPIFCSYYKKILTWTPIILSIIILSNK